MTTKGEVRGACLCGAVRVTAKVEGRGVGACHCGICRKWGGGPMLAIECGDEVRFDGAEHIAVYGSSDWAERGFCKVCGTHLFYRLRDGHFHALPAGLIDDDEQWVFDHQVFIDEKPAYYTFANPTRNMTGAEVFAAFGASPDGESDGNR